MNDYEAKQETRRERYEQLAKDARQEAEQQFNGPAGQQLQAMGGEPVKVGHHSEKRHRRLIERGHSEMRKGCEALDKAKHYEEKAASVGRGGISSDDPGAVEKLRRKLDKAEQYHKLMKDTNRIIRSKPRNIYTDAKGDKLAAFGLTPEASRKLFKPDFCGRIGFPDYALTNNSATIRRTRKRLAELEKTETREDVVERHGDIEYREEENRVRLVFPGKPPLATRDLLKSHAFRWAPSVGAWQRHLNPQGKYHAREVLRAIEYEARVQAAEAEGMSRSDAQAVIEAEDKGRTQR